MQAVTLKGQSAATLKANAASIPESTKLQIATIQAMVKRVIGPFENGGEANIPPVDQYDCIVVDECHRGYLLDRELSDREFLFRDEDDYISKYRRVPASIQLEIIAEKKKQLVGA